MISKNAFAFNDSVQTQIACALRRSGQGLMWLRRPLRGLRHNRFLPNWHGASDHRQIWSKRHCGVGDEVAVVATCLFVRFCVCKASAFAFHEDSYRPFHCTISHFTAPHPATARSLPHLPAVWRTRRQEARNVFRLETSSALLEQERPRAVGLYPPVPISGKSPKCRFRTVPRKKHPQPAFPLALPPMSSNALHPSGSQSPSICSSCPLQL